ncbi:MAG: hypothetical protein AAGJ19_05300 [Myxococcota bacterium]
MKKRKKVWVSLKNLSIAGASGLASCTAGEGGAARAPVADEAKDKASKEGEGEAEAEVAMETTGGAKGEGKAAMGSEGEGEGEGAADLATDNLAYLTQLGLIRGHLHVGYELFKAGHAEAAKTHMKHPEHELYADLVPAFQARKASGFSKELQALAVGVEEGKPAKEVEAAYDGLTAAITKNEKAAETGAPKERLELAAALVRVAGEEYAIAVVDGKMKNAHEYQDALGFTTVARGIVSELPDGEAKSKASEMLDEVLGKMWPGLVPPDELKTAADELYGTAARIDLLAARL